MRLLLLASMVLFIISPADAMFEDSFLYFPDSELIATPAAAGLAFADVTFPAADGTRLQGWFVAGDTMRPVVLYCHGNAGNISHRIEALAQLHRLGLSVFIFDYRGYGKSAGKPSEDGTYQDALGARAWLRQQGVEPSRTIYFGRSLGAAVALQLALEQPPAGLVLETPFTSIAAMGRHHYPLLYRALGWLVDLDYDNLRKIPAVKTRLLITHGTADTIVSPAMAKQLYQLAPEPKRLLLLPDLDHNDNFFGSVAYRQAWQTFLTAIMAHHELNL